MTETKRASVEELRADALRSIAKMGADAGEWGSQTGSDAEEASYLLLTESIKDAERATNTLADRLVEAERALSQSIIATCGHAPNHVKAELAEQRDRNAYLTERAEYWQRVAKDAERERDEMVAALDTQTRETSRVIGELDEARGQLVDVHGSCDLTISRLQAENERLREAIAFAIDDCSFKETTKKGMSMRLRAALRQTGGEKGGGRT